MPLIAFDRNSRYVSSSRKMVIAPFHLPTVARPGENERDVRRKGLAPGLGCVVVGFVGLTNGILYP